MASKVQLCNMALVHVGSRSTIAAMDEDSVEARICNSVFDGVRDDLLKVSDWGFARRVEVLAPRAETPAPGWSYVYSMPNNCLRFRGIWLGPVLTVKLPLVAWELQSIADTSGNDVVAVCTNQDQAYGWYTRSISNTELFTAGFQKAFRWALAEAIALSITNSASLAANVARVAQTRINEGIAMDANEGIQIVGDRAPDWITARGAGNSED